LTEFFERLRERLLRISHSALSSLHLLTACADLDSASLAFYCLRLHSYLCLRTWDTSAFIVSSQQDDRLLLAGSQWGKYACRCYNYEKQERKFKRAILKAPYTAGKKEMASLAKAQQR
jgi:hypothetical protein